MKKKILYLDNHQKDRELLKKILIKTGYQVCAISLDEKMREYKDYLSFDLYIIDLSLEDEIGFSICKEIRNKIDAPIIILSYDPEEYCKIKSFQSGADDYLSKPYLAQELLARIQAILKRYSKDKSVLNSSGVTINKNKQTVWLYGRVIDLTPTEYKLLVVLMENQGYVLSYSFIAQEVWGWAAENCAANVATNVNRIRNKIGKEKIFTVKNIGYRFN